METWPPGAPRLPSSSPEPKALREQRRRKDALLGALTAFFAAVVALTCAGRGAVARAPLPVHSGVPVSLREPAPPAPPLLGRATSLDVPPRDVRRAPELGRFFAALEGLERGERRDSVRVLWYGDSHTAADYLSGSVRSALARRYGSGGPGFLRLGVYPYRHDGVTLGRSGRFRVEPVSPASRTPQGDGVFGLGGMRVFPSADAGRVTVKLLPGAVRGKARFNLLFDLPHGSGFVVTLGPQRVEVRDGKGALRLPNTPILRLPLEGEPTDVLMLETRRGKPRLYGVIVESSEPGVVLDTVGIDGARIATTLAWAEAPFVAEVAARKPDLAVLAFGTNEAFDDLRVSAYQKELTSLIGRIKKGAPDADCLVLGPPDALSPGGEPAPRVASIGAVYAATARESGCAFVSQQLLMGGPGSFMSWLRQDPPLARADRIHFTPKGYRRLGALLSEAVFGETEAAEAGSPAASR